MGHWVLRPGDGGEYRDFLGDGILEYFGGMSDSICPSSLSVQ